ncbi:MAG: zinc ribbon domain-containing protein [Thermoguttaceae bacterium]
MSLINCPECKKPVSETAAACPGCGFALTPDIVAVLKEKKQKEGQVGVLIALGVFLVFVVLCSGVFTSSPSSSTPSGDSSAQVKAQAHVPTVAETKLTLANFGKIETGMDRYDVGDILGRDYKTVAKSEFGQNTDYDLTTESLEWQDGFRVVTCMFQNGKLVSKAQAGLE